MTRDYDRAAASWESQRALDCADAHEDMDDQLDEPERCGHGIPEDEQCLDCDTDDEEWDEEDDDGDDA